MRIFNFRLVLAALAILALTLGGCILSGTFTIVQDMTLTGFGGFYAYQVDLTEEEDWDDHQENIEFIDLVGFEMWVDNEGASPVTFEAYVDELGSLCSDIACVQSSATHFKIIDGLTLPPGETHLTYGESFSYIRNFDRLKTLALSGQFNFYATSDPFSVAMTIDSAKVIVTFTAGK